MNPNRWRSENSINRYVDTLNWSDEPIITWHKVDHYGITRDMVAWIDNTILNGWICPPGARCFYFEKEDDVVLFKLTWC